MLTLAQFTNILPTIQSLTFIAHDQPIPAHFHITELAYLQKSFIDCGGTKRHEQFASMQIWVAGDTDHRLTPAKLSTIITMGADLIPDAHIPLMIEYQGYTLESYQVSRDGTAFLLMPIFTNCLAQDKCGIAPNQLTSKATCCSGGGCC